MIRLAIEKIAELTEEEKSSITSFTILDDLDAWDSLAKVSFLVFSSTEFGIQLDGRDINSAQAVQDLLDLIQQKIDEKDAKVSS